MPHAARVEVGPDGIKFHACSSESCPACEIGNALAEHLLSPPSCVKTGLGPLVYSGVGCFELAGITHGKHNSLHRFNGFYRVAPAGGQRNGAQQYQGSVNDDVLVWWSPGLSAWQFELWHLVDSKTADQPGSIRVNASDNEALECVGRDTEVHVSGAPQCRARIRSSSNDPAWLADARERSGAAGTLEQLQQCCRECVQSQL